jgi:hypothetical protein
MSSINLAQRATYGELTVEEVNGATKEMLEENYYFGFAVLYWASRHCGTEVVEAILDKKVNIDGLSGEVSVVVATFY